MEIRKGIKKCDKDGKEYWAIVVGARSRLNRKIRPQKRLTGFETYAEAEKAYWQWYQWCQKEVARQEGLGLSWGEVIDAWETWYYRYPSSRWDPGTVKDYIAILHNWTKGWLKRSARDLTVTDGFQMIEEAKQAGASTRRLYQIKTTVNTVYKWGMGAGKIQHKDHTPMFGIELAKRDQEKLPEIMSRSEVALLLARSEAAEHDWHPVWKTAAYTGLRASELEGLRREDFDLVPVEVGQALDRSEAEKKSYGMVRISRQWKKKESSYGATKGRYWRTVPVNKELYWFLRGHFGSTDFGKDEHGTRVFPLLPELRRGQQAAVLKLFCASQKLKLVKFHTFRACFATHLLALGVPEIQVMKIGGWKDRETMMIYVRLAGIDEAGATSKLDFSTDQVQLAPAPVDTNVVSIFSRSK
jgi:integrase